MNLLHTSKTIPKRFYYIPLKQVCKENGFGIVLEVGNTIVLVLF
jgi:hypothetical protein